MMKFHFFSEKNMATAGGWSFGGSLFRSGSLRFGVHSRERYPLSLCGLNAVLFFACHTKTALQRSTNTAPTKIAYIRSLYFFALRSRVTRPSGQNSAMKKGVKHYNTVAMVQQKRFGVWHRAPPASEEPPKNKGRF